MRIEQAKTSDHKELTELTKKSKAYWTYSSEQLKKWKDDLTITENYLNVNRVYKLNDKKSIIGYYSYFNIDASTIKLDNLFIKPKYIRKGLGIILMKDFIKRVKKEKNNQIILDSDPNAEGFYKKFGFEVIGKLESSIKGRFLQIMKKQL